MGVRREGREAAVQYLYQRDLNPASDLADLAVFYKMRGLSPSARRFSDGLIRGVLEKQTAIDDLIKANAENYELHRISVVDRNILRLAIYEMTECADIPPVVSINEGIEIAKKYSTEESGKFVNGVLDRVRTKLDRPPRAASTHGNLK
jgi:N utilization substance protein B